MKTSDRSLLQKRANLQRRRRRQRLVTQAREAALIRAEGGSSYRAGKFGAEHVSSRGKTQRGRGRGNGRGRGRGGGRVRGRGSGRGKGITGSKRTALKRHRPPSSTSSSLDSLRNSSEDTDTECGICGDANRPQSH